MRRLAFLRYAIEADDALWWERVEFRVRSLFLGDLLGWAVVLVSLGYLLGHLAVWAERGFQIVGG